MKINCVSCGFKVELDDAYSDYEGLIKCFACNALLEVKIEQDCIKSVNFVMLMPRPSNEEECARTY